MTEPSQVPMSKTRLYALVASLVASIIAAVVQTVRQPSAPPPPVVTTVAPAGPKGMAVFGPSQSLNAGSVSISADGGNPVPVEQVLGASFNLGGYTSDAGVEAGASQLTGSATPLLVGCDVCVDDGSSTTIYCAADSAVNATTGSAHKGIPLSTTAQLCRLFPVKDASGVYCVTAAGSPVAFIAHCY